ACMVKKIGFTNKVYDSAMICKTISRLIYHDTALILPWTCWTIAYRIGETFCALFHSGKHLIINTISLVKPRSFDKYIFILLPCRGLIFTSSRATYATK